MNPTAVHRRPLYLWRGVLPTSADLQLLRFYLATSGRPRLPFEYTLLYPKRCFPAYAAAVSSLSPLHM